jgi:hypothetical protein
VRRTPTNDTSSSWNRSSDACATWRATCSATSPRGKPCPTTTRRRWTPRGCAIRNPCAVWGRWSARRRRSGARSRRLSGARERGSATPSWDLRCARRARRCGASRPRWGQSRWGWGWSPSPSQGLWRTRPTEPDTLTPALDDRPPRGAQPLGAAHRAAGAGGLHCRGGVRQRRARRARPRDPATPPARAAPLQRTLERPAATTRRTETAARPARRALPPRARPKSAARPLARTRPANHGARRADSAQPTRAKRPA